MARYVQFERQDGSEKFYVLDSAVISIWQKTPSDPVSLGVSTFTIPVKGTIQDVRRLLAADFAN